MTLVRRLGSRSVSGRRSLLALLCALAAASSLVPASAKQSSGMIKYACGSPAMAHRLPEGDCGVRITDVKPGAQFTLTPGKEADLDIYFYNAKAEISEYVAGCGHGAITGGVPADAVYALVLLSPGTVSPGCPQLVDLHWATNVGFVYSD